MGAGGAGEVGAPDEVLAAGACDAVSPVARPLPPEEPHPLHTLIRQRSLHRSSGESAESQVVHAGQVGQPGKRRVTTIAARSGARRNWVASTAARSGARRNWVAS